MKNIIILFSLVTLLSACVDPKEKPTPDPEKQEKELPSQDISKTTYTETGQLITTEATVLSVEDDLIMPGDYLTTVMTVVTKELDTLRFLDMEEHKPLINKKISLQYKLETGRRLLVCFDCENYGQKIKLYDHSSFPDKVTFESFKLKKYTPDEYIIPASMFLMEKEDGQTEEFRSLDIGMIADSAKMYSAYHPYGVVTPLSPRLLEITPLSESNDLIKLKLLKDEAEDAAFRSMVGDAYDLFVNSTGLTSEEEDLDGLNAAVKASAVRGLYTQMENIVMQDASNNFWAAVIDDNKVIYFTNRADYKTRLPKTIEQWRARFKDYEIIYKSAE